MRAALADAGGNRMLAARLLGLPIRSFYNIAKRLHLELGPQRDTQAIADAARKARQARTKPTRPT